MLHVKAPEYVDLISAYSIFLGGSIEMNTAELWQERLAAALGGYPDSVILLNPRRDDWDSSWEQDPTPGTRFHEQVTWELDMQDMANTLVYYFDPATKSPITLLELGAYGYGFSQHVVVCCPKEFWRYGNVAVFCERHSIKLVHTFEQLVIELNNRIIDDGL